MTLFLKAFQDLRFDDGKKILPATAASSHAQGHVIGWEDAKFYYLRPDKLHEYLLYFYKKKSMLFPLTPRSLWAELAANQLLRSDATQHTYPKRIAGRQMRLIWLPKDKLNKMEDALNATDLSRTNATRVA